MKIGIIGSGNIGGTLGVHLVNAGYKVMFSSRHPTELNDLAVKAGKNASIGTVEQAANFGEALILSVPFWANEEVAGKIGPQKGKAIIETTNPYPGRDGAMAQNVRDSGRAASKFVADLFPEAHILKAFNAIYFKDLQEQAFRTAERRAIPYAGNHQGSLNMLKKLIHDIGFDSVYVGKLSESHIMDPDQKLYTKDLTADEMKQLINKD